MASPEENTHWQDWAEYTQQRVDLAERRLQALQDHVLEWSTWGFRTNGVLDQLGDAIAHLQSDMEEVKSDIRLQHRIWVAVAQHLNLPFDQDDDTER